jgi:arylsulfatase A-like enzyme
MRHTTVLISAPILVLAIALAGSCGGGGTKHDEAQATGASLIVIAVEGLRADALGCYGNPDATTPALDALATESYLFEQAWSQSPTMMPSLASTMTGLYPTTHGLVEPGHRLASEPTTLAEVAGARGLATAGFMQGAEGGDNFGLGKGFTTFRIGPEPGIAGLEWLDRHAEENVFLLVGGFSAARLGQAAETPEGFKNRLANAIAAIANGEPASLGEADVATAKQAYARHVSTIDAALAELIVNLRSRGLLDRSTLVVLGTSGLAIQEHGNLFGDGLWPETTHVPLLIRRPDGQAARISKVVELVDLMPTLAAAIGGTLPEGLQGADLAPVMAGAGNPPYIAFAETDRRGASRAAVMDGMMLLTTEGESLLYNLTNDPGASTDVSAEFPKRAEVLTSHLEAWGKMVAAASYDPNRRTEELDEETLEQLKSLGYIQ